MSKENGKRRETLLVLAAIVAATLIIHWRTVCLCGRFIFYDSVILFYPLAEYYQHAPLRDLMWTPEAGLGWPLFLSGYWTTFAPVNLLAFLAPTDSAWLYNLLCWGYHVAAGIVTYCCARRMNLSKPAALTTALVYLLGNYVLYERFNILTVSGLWLAPALLMLQPRTERGGVVAIAVVVGVGVLSCSPAIWVVTLAFCTTFLVVRFWQSAALVPAFLRWTGAVACGACIGAIQALPSAWLAFASARGLDSPPAFSPRPFLQAVLGLLITHFDTIPKVIFNEDTYVGVASLVLAAVAILVPPRSREVKFFLAWTVVAFLFALGTSTPLWWLVLRVPPARILGSPVRWLLVLGFSVAMMAGYAVDKLAEGRGTRLLGRIARVGVVLYGLIWIASLLAYLALVIGDAKLREYGNKRIEALRAKPPHFHSQTFYEHKLNGMIRAVREAVAPWNSHFWGPWCGMVVLLSTARRMSRESHPPAVWAWACAAAVGMELLTVNLPYCNLKAVSCGAPAPCGVADGLPKAPSLDRLFSFYTLTPQYRLVEELGPASARERSQVHAQFFHDVFFPYTNVPRHLHHFANSLPLIPRRENMLLEPLGWPRVFVGGQYVGYIWDPYLSPEEKAARFLNRLKLLRIFNGRYVVSTLPLSDPSLKAVRQYNLPLSPRMDPVTVYLYEVADVLPRAFLAPEARAVARDEEAFQALVAPEFDPRKTVLLSMATSPPPCSPPLSAAGSSATVEEYLPRCVRIRVHSDGEGYLVLSDAWSWEWAAAVDGKESQLFRANLGCRAVRVGPGEHVVEFRHHARMLQRGFMLGGISVTVLCVWTALGFVRRRRAGPREATDGPVAAP